MRPLSVIFKFLWKNNNYYYRKFFIQKIILVLEFLSLHKSYICIALLDIIIRTHNLKCFVQIFIIKGVSTKERNAIVLAQSTPFIHFFIIILNKSCDNFQMT